MSYILRRADDTLARHGSGHSSSPGKLSISRVPASAAAASPPAAAAKNGPPADVPMEQQLPPQPPGMGGGGGSISLGGNYSVQSLLARDGRNPLTSNGMSGSYPTELWVLERVKELVSMYDDPLYSFFSRVGALTHNQSLRTTALFGSAAVAELFRGDTSQERFFHRMPGNTLDRERKANNYGALSEDLIFLNKDEKDDNGSKRRATGPGNYPTVGKIGDPNDGSSLSSSAAAAAPVSPFASYVYDDDDDDDDGGGGGRVGGSSFSSSSSSSSGGGVRVARPSDSEVLRRGALGQTFAGHALDHEKKGESTQVAVPDAGAIAVSTHDAEGGSRPAFLLPAGSAAASSAAVVKGTGMEAADGVSAAYRVRDTALNIYVNSADGKTAEPVFNIEDGDVVAARRLLNGQQLSDADERLWRTIYAGGEGVTRPASRMAPADLSARQQAQRAQIVQYASSLVDPSELQWKLLPEHLRTIFLTDEAAAALEHATWLAHYQQPWDGNATPAQQVRTIARERQMVPAIDLMTHEMVRVPFMTLVVNVIIYWRQRRAADRSRAGESLDAINGVILTLRTMRESPQGFVSLMGHYDVEARRSRYQTQLKRNAYQAETGNYWSDMDTTFYSRAVPPGGQPHGRHVAQFMRRQQTNQGSAAMTAAVQAAVMNAPHGSNPIHTLQDARFRYGWTMAALGGSFK